MIMVGVVTYLVTFNINTMSRAWLKSYHKRRDRIVRCMKDGIMRDDRAHLGPMPWWYGVNISSPAAKTKPTWVSNKWKRRAGRYEETFRLVRKKSEPSEWYIVAFCMYYLVISPWSQAAARYRKRRREPQPDGLDAEAGKAEQ